jgi:hypothetical protein
VTVLRVAGVRDLPDTGWLFDDAAVFGLLSREAGAVPRLDGWTAADVADCVVTKAGAGGLDDDGWWLVAEVAAGCETLAQMRASRAAETVCAQTFVAAWQLSLRLPHPPRSLRTRHARRFPPGDAYVLAALDVRDAGTRLAVALADRGWLDGDALAGWVHDAMFGLALCRRALREFIDLVAALPVDLAGGCADRRLPATGRLMLAERRGGGRGRVTGSHDTIRAVAPRPRARAPVIPACRKSSEQPGPYAA